MAVAVALLGAAAGAAIKVALDYLESYSVKKIGRLRNFSKDLEKLKQSIRMIQELLDDAEMKQVNDKAVQRWLMKLEDVAFDADYVFDQVNYQLLRKKVQRGTKKKVSSKTFTLFRSKMAGEIKNIKDELKSITKEAKDLGLYERMASAPARGAGADKQANKETDSLSLDPVFMGRENDVGKIVKMVTSNSSTEKLVSVLPIVGMGGLGKTTLTREVYNAPKIISHFENRIWVHVGLDFDPLVVFKKTLESLTEKNVDGSREIVLRKLQRGLSGKRYLLVLDNFWDEDNQKWKKDFIISLKAISDVKGNVIMVTTRNSNVATIVKDIGVYELGVLTNENCWSIIKANAFGGEVIPAEFETIGKNIAKRCHGLPFAAQVVGSLLRSKTKDEWVSIDETWLSKFGGDGNIVSKMLKLSYDHFPSPSLRRCFAFCSIIPRRWWLHKEEMIQLWMAEGYLQTEKEANMETVGNSRIMELGSLNNLKGELEIHNLERVCDKEEAKNARLFHKPNILKLKLVWNERESGQVVTNDEHVLEGLQPHPALKSLEIKGFESKSFPLWTLRMSVMEDLEDRWIRLDNLLEVILSDCKDCEEIPMLGHLPCLKSLSLRHLPNVKSIGSSFYGINENEVNKEMIVVFPALEKLELVGMANLTEWRKELAALLIATWYDFPEFL